MREDLMSLKIIIEKTFCTQVEVTRGWKKLHNEDRHYHGTSYLRITGSIGWAGQNVISTHCRKRLRASENFTLDIRNLWDTWVAVFGQQTFRLYLLPVGSSCLSRSVHTRIPKAKVMNKCLTSSSPNTFKILCLFVFLTLQPIVFVFSQPGRGI